MGPDGLNNGANLLFIVPYYWGVWRPEYEKILSKQKPGTFFTGYCPIPHRKMTTLDVTPIQYFVWVVDHKGKVRKWKCVFLRSLPRSKKRFRSCGRLIVHVPFPAPTWCIGSGVNNSLVHFVRYLYKVNLFPE